MFIKHFHRAELYIHFPIQSSRHPCEGGGATRILGREQLGQCGEISQALGSQRTVSGQGTALQIGGWTSIS